MRGQEVDHTVAERRIDELEVGLVDHHDHSLGYLCTEFSEGFSGQRCAGRVVGIGDHDELGLVGDRVEQPGQVGGFVDERNGDRLAVEKPGVDRVHLERTPGIQHLVAGIHIGADKAMKDGRTTGAYGDICDRKGLPVGDRLAHLDRPMVGIPVDSGDDVGDRLDDLREWLHRVFIRRQLDGIGDTQFLLGLLCVLARLVGRHERDSVAGTSDRRHELDGRRSGRFRTLESRPKPLAR